MSDEKKSSARFEASDDGADAQAILSRRNFLIKTALVGAGLTFTAGAACDDTTTGPSDTGTDGTRDAGGDTEPQPCLAADVGRDIPPDQPQICLTTDVTPDTLPEACLSPPEDTVDAPQDIFPEACLSPPEDTSDDAPQVCLGMPPPDATEDV